MQNSAPAAIAKASIFHAEIPEASLALGAIIKKENMQSRLFIKVLDQPKIIYFLTCASSCNRCFP